MHFFDADRLAGKDRAEINLSSAHTDATTVGDHDGLVVERIIDVGQPGIGTGEGLIDFCRALQLEKLLKGSFSAIVGGHPETIA